ncbi:hypothetical protein [Rhizobium changzhiense]|uniref:Uncharacterized protein n=1 Tax=Rhizobium changzhiense TaxID=2692317 RepID=A0ABR6ABI2_9HYPH|nr:hypothetical protein [Rhizobium changzhiense]MBA5804025.1 hypothetical protein [Rhizobium changzhiense]
MAEQEKEKLIMGIRDILKGIDQCDTASDELEGWWETSAGASFGAEKLRLVEAFVTASYNNAIAAAAASVDGMASSEPILSDAVRVIKSLQLPV